MATSIKELEKKAKIEMYAKEFSKMYKPSWSTTTMKKYDGTPKHD